jgi:AcrR family transcriptional regulator
MQVLKDEVRTRIQQSALKVFAERGFEGATMAQIASAADIATANLYRYYPGKQELFDAVVPLELVQRFEALLEPAVEAVASIATVELPPGPEEASRALLKFWLDHRLVSVILLARAEGTAYADYGERFVSQLLHLSLSVFSKQYPEVLLPESVRMVFRQVFENTRRTLANILLTCTDESDIVMAIQAFRSYQLAGLWALVRFSASSGRLPH